MEGRSAQFIWYDREGRGRNLYACFRYVFNVDSGVRRAVLHLFADTTYQLFVNGAFVEFGPVRFDPRFPQYDSVDLAPWLQQGKNVVAVLVNSIQHKTFKGIPNQGGFIAWGSVELEDGSIVKLDTTPGRWRAVPDMARSRYVGKFSFALSAAEYYDQRGEQPGWTHVGFDDRGWPPAVILRNQEAWGRLTPRRIPFMRRDMVPVRAVRHVLPLLASEVRYSWWAPFPPHYEDDRAAYSPFFAFRTWVYSPCEQVVNVGTFWGDNWLNGEKVARGTDCYLRPMRINQKWALRQGWNYLFGCVDAYQDIVEQYFAVPRDSGIIFDAKRGVGDGVYTFERTRMLTVEEYERVFAKKDMPYAPTDALKEIGGWVAVHRDDAAESPARETSWDLYGDAVEEVTADGLVGHTFRLQDYPHGFSLLLDLGKIHLVWPRLQFTGVRGARIDVTSNEHLCGDGQHLRLMHHYPAADRIVCVRDEVEWMPAQARGVRYLMITVRNASQDVTLKGLSLRSASYPVKQVGSFHCSDRLLTEIWEMCARTLATNMEDAYDDCVGRERGMYGRDTIIQYFVNLATFGDQALMGRCLQLFGQSPDGTGKFRAVYPNTGDYTIADFALNMVEGYWAYYRYSGDLARIREDWGAIKQNLAWFHELADERSDLLLDADWHVKRGVHAHYGGFHGDLAAQGYMSVSGVHCVFSCMYLSALRSAVELARVVGDAREARELEKRARRVAQSIRSTFWNRRLGCYSDNLARDTHSAHASLLAVRSGAAARAQWPALRRYIARELRSVFVNGYDPSEGCKFSPSFAFYLFEALYQLGMAATAEELMRQGWGWMLAQGLRTCGEHFDTRQSLCHAWSASPAYFLSRHVLGVQYPAAPDYSRVEIRVETAGVTEAEGAYPHPRGVVKVKWHMERGRRVFDYVKAPRGVRVIIHQ
ncbi:MAG: glycoside hydrolase family 78 protein [bacterium]|nr:glycoside hydrolase family 78 protein [bacterium]